MKLEFVKLSPTQNMTIIVKSPVARADHSRVAAALMDYSGVYAEQVGFVEPGTLAGVNNRLQMMGGEFCGNAAMCMACLTARDAGIADGETRCVPVEISGASDMLSATVARRGDSYVARVDMPLPDSIELKEDLSIVRLPGIAHVIVKCGDPELMKAGAEARLRDIAAGLDEEAVGLMLYSPEKNRLIPLVYVKSTDTMIWERGCGSGSAATGALICCEQRADATVPLEQPGGVITARGKWNDGIVSLSIEGHVKLACEGMAFV